MIGIAAIVVVIAWGFVQPMSFLPHARIVIGVPYRMTDLPDNIIPMGETVYHPKPQNPTGHPGIDFQWNSGERHDVIASAEGVVTNISEGTSDGRGWDVETENGMYLLRYKELDDVASGLRVGDAIRKGDLVGHVGRYCDSYQYCWFNLHWEFASVSLLRDRFCPVTYFDAVSYESITKLWASIPLDAEQGIKAKFPDICSGDYVGAVE